MTAPEQTLSLSAPAEQDLAAAFDDAVADLLAGRPFDREVFLARYPQLAEPLAGLECLTAVAPPPGPDASSASLPAQIGPYRIERELGAGGFGVVYLAYDPDVRRRVALKVLHPARLDQPEAILRFQREAHATARLRHPGIVQLYDYSRQGPPYYLATEWVEGIDPRLWCRQNAADPRAIADLLARIAEAVDHAHRQGVCHRDLKPGNILIDAEGRPHILDFGLARLEQLAEETAAMPTSEGRILGSLPYMAPEQAAGHSHEADERSDVYSLGVILYELLTGQLPFQGPAYALPARVVEEHAPPPSLFNRALPRDLEAVCLKALAQRREQRYDSAAALAADLRAFLAEKPTVAQPLTLWRRIVRGLNRRHREMTLHGWTLLLNLLGITILVGCGLANLVELTLPPGHRWYPIVLIKGGQVLLMLWLAARFRPAREPRLTAAERQILALVPGYYGGSCVLLILNFLLEEPIPVPPMQAVLSGMAFMTLGAIIWGWFYLWAAFFFLLAIVITFCNPYGFLALGLGWMLCLFLGSLHLRSTR